MAKRKSRRSATRAMSRSAVPETAEGTEIASTTSSEPEQLSRRSKHLKRFVDSAVDTVFQYFWSAVIVTILAAVGAFWYYLRGSGHLWAYVEFVAGFLSASVLLIAISTFFILLKRHRTSTVERLRTAKFFSLEKGWLDHAVNRDRAITEYNEALTAISSETAAVGKSMNRGTKQIGSVKHPSAQEGRAGGLKVASKIADKLNDHASKIEKSLAKFEAITQLLIESDAGYLQWFTPTTEQDKTNLKVARLEYATLLENTEPAIEGVRYFRQSQIGLKGTSQDLNTALNRMIDACDRIIVAMQKGATHWREAIALSDRKLGV